MHFDANTEGEKARLDFLARRLTELNNTASQILNFLSFSIAAAVAFLAPSTEGRRFDPPYAALLQGFQPLKLVAAISTSPSRFSQEAH
jgi:hypothetical protein